MHPEARPHPLQGSPRQPRQVSSLPLGVWRKGSPKELRQSVWEGRLTSTCGPEEGSGDVGGKGEGQGSRLTDVTG